jgi:L-seryl-tRNA(Ser) seleniumtransferase
MIGADAGSLHARAEKIASKLRSKAPRALVEVVAETAEVGGGSYPGVELESWVLRITVPDRSEQELETTCRAGDPPVIGRVRDGALLLDPRTVSRAEEEEFIDVVAYALRGDG